MAAIRALQDSGSPQLEAALRQFDAKRIATQLQSTAKAVVAMQDIFGDSGRSNVPMMELLTSLDALTQGGMVSMSPGEAERMVRTSYRVAKDAGISLEAMVGKTAAAGDQAERMGLDRTFGVVAAQSGVNFGNAYGQTGQGELNAFGRQTRDMLGEQDAQLSLEAGRSAVNNLFGTTLRMNETSAFGKGTEAAALVAAINSNDPTATVKVNGKDKHIGDLRAADFNSIMTNSGVAADTANMTLGETRANQEFGMQTVGLTRQLQARNLANTVLQQGFSSGTVQRMTKLGLSETEALKASEQVGQKMGETLMNMSAEDQANRQRRNAILSDTLLSEMAGIAKFNPDEMQQIQRLETNGTSATDARKQVVSKRFTQRELLDAAESGYGQLDQTAVERGYKSAQNILQLNNPEAIKQAEQKRKEQAQQTRVETALAPLGRTPVMQRVVDALEKPEAEFTQAIGKMLGGIDKQEIAATLLPLELEAVKAGNDGDLVRLEALKKGGVHAESQLKSDAKARGIELQEMLDQTERAEQAEKELMTGVKPEDVSGLLGGSKKFGDAERQAKLVALRPVSAAARQVRSLLTARDHGGTEGLSKAERSLRQLKTVRDLNAGLKKPANAEDAENKTQILEGIMQGGDKAKAAAAALRKSWEGHEMTDAVQNWATQLDEAAEHGGVNDTIKQMAVSKDEAVDNAVAGTPKAKAQAAADAEQQKVAQAAEAKAKQKPVSPVMAAVQAGLAQGAAMFPASADAMNTAMDAMRNLAPDAAAQITQAIGNFDAVGKNPFDPDKAVRPAGQAQPAADLGKDKAGLPTKIVITGKVTMHKDGTGTVDLQTPGSTPVAQDNL